MPKFVQFKDTIRDETGAIVPLAEIEVRTLAGGLATIYSDEGVTPIVQPFDATADGVVEFYALAGEYELTATRGSDVYTAAVYATDALHQGGRKNWDTRANLVADWVDGLYPDGTILSDGTVQYVASAGATAIPDLPGLLPFGIHLSTSKSYPCEAYQPSITRVAVDVGSDLYRHVPSIAVKSASHVLGAYLYNDLSDAESATGQTAGFVRSSDNGATWTAKAAELNASGTATNPLTPVADGRIQGEVFVLYDGSADQEIATVAHRGGAAGTNRGFISFRSATSNDPTAQKWTNYGVRFNSTTNAIDLSNTDISGSSAASGFKLTYTLDGTEYDIVPFKPVFGVDGELVVPLVLVTSFGVDMRIGFAVRESGAWSMRGVVPLGEAGAGDSWEPTTWQAEDGTWYCQCRNNSAVGGISSDNHILSVSADLQSWTPWALLDEDIHVNRQMRMRATSALYLGVGSSHESNRNNLALFASIDGHQWVHGATIGAEVDGDDFTHYSDIDVFGGSAYVLYSEERPQATSAAPNEIRFARFALPTETPIMGTAKNVYEFDSGTAPSVTGGVLTIPPRQMGSVAALGAPYVLTLRARVSVAPSTTPYKIASIGDEALGYFSIEYRDNGGTTELWSGGVYVSDVAAPTEYADFQIAVDPRRGFVSCLGQNMALRRYARVYLGDTTIPATAQTGNILYDGAACEITAYPNGLPRQFVPEFPNIQAGQVLAKSDVGDVDVVLDTPAGAVSTFRHRVAGSTMASRYWNATLAVLRDQVAGVNITEMTSSLWRALVPADFDGRVTMKGFLNFGAKTILTISDGVITPTKSYHAVDTEGGAATDDLDTITATTTGDILFLQTNSSARDVVVKHATGNIFCGSDRTLNNVADRIGFMCDGANWHMISYADN